MIFGMPIISFLAFLSWPVIFIAAALIIYRIMAKQDAQMDDSEFEQGSEFKREGGEAQ